MIINKLGGMGINASKIKEIRNKIKNVGSDPNSKGGAAPTAPVGIEYGGFGGATRSRGFSRLNDDDISDTFSFQDQFSASPRGSRAGFGRARSAVDRTNTGLGFGNLGSTTKKDRTQGKISSMLGLSGRR